MYIIYLKLLKVDLRFFLNLSPPVALWTGTQGGPPPPCPHIPTPLIQDTSLGY